jgi:hypothetical protein
MTFIIKAVKSEIRKFEYRNPKQIQMTEIQNPKQRRYVGGYSRFGHADFEFRYRFRREASCGGFRI